MTAGFRCCLTDCLFAWKVGRCQCLLQSSDFAARTRVGANLESSSSRTTDCFNPESEYKIGYIVSDNSQGQGRGNNNSILRDF